MGQGAGGDLRCFLTCGVLQADAWPEEDILLHLGLENLFGRGLPAATRSAILSRLPSVCRAARPPATCQARVRRMNNTFDRLVRFRFVASPAALVNLYRPTRDTTLFDRLHRPGPARQARSGRTAHRPTAASATVRCSSGFGRRCAGRGRGTCLGSIGLARDYFSRQTDRRGVFRDRSGSQPLSHQRPRTPSRGRRAGTGRAQAGQVSSTKLQSGWAGISLVTKVFPGEPELPPCSEDSAVPSFRSAA